ncbi:MAG: hypothetical protein GXO89_09120 [Chlorobi bacterium]|nr:hypothetical protein [Chlorobiota bacterium]
MMNCELIKEKADQLLFEQEKQLMTDVFEHIESCESCRAYYNESQKAIKTMEWAKKEPKLRNPESLTNSILTAIEDTGQIPKSNTKNQKTIRLITRTLAAASISLMMIFGVEQYIVIHKITELENQVSQVSYKTNNISFKNILRYNAGMQLFTIKKFLNKDFTKRDFRNFKARIMFARLSAIAMNEMENQIIVNQGFIREQQSTPNIN